MLVKIKETDVKTVIFTVYDDIAKNIGLYPCMMHKVMKDKIRLIVQTYSGKFLSYDIKVKGDYVSYVKRGE